MRNKKLLTLIGTVCLVLALITLPFMGACAPEEVTPPPEDEKPPTPEKYGGILTRIFEVGPKVLGYPLDMTNIDEEGVCAATERLQFLTPEGETMPWLNESWEVAPDKKSVTFTLRKGVKFHDGSILNAEAVKWNLDMQKSAGKGISLATSVDVIDEYRYRVNLEKWSNGIWNDMAHVSAMHSKEAVEKNGVEWARNHVVGTGAFKFVSFKPDVSITFERFDDYWGGKPYLDGIVHLFIKDPMTIQTALRMGDAQGLHSGAMEPQAIKALVDEGFTIMKKFNLTFALFPASANPDSVYADKRVREAVEYAIDKVALAQGLGYGFWKAAYQVSAPGYTGYNEDLKGRQYDPMKARQLLANAGYPDGFETTIYASTRQPRDAMVAIQSYLGAVGIDVDLEVLAYGKIAEMRKEGWKDGLMLYWMAEYGYNLKTVELYFSTTTRYYPCMKRPPGAWQELIDEASVALDFETYAALTKKAVRIIQEDATAIPVWYRAHSFIWAPNVHDTGVFTADPFSQWFPGKMWLSK